MGATQSLVKSSNQGWLSVFITSHIASHKSAYVQIGVQQGFAVSMCRNTQLQHDCMPLQSLQLHALSWWSFAMIAMRLPIAE